MNEIVATFLQILQKLYYCNYNKNYVNKCLDINFEIK